MKLEPVYLVEPPPSRPTRRQMFAAIGLTAIGSVVLTSTGWLVFGGDSHGVEGEEPSRPSERLLWARSLADADDETLQRHAVGLLFVINSEAPHDPELWTIVERLAIHIIEDDRVPNRRLLAKSVRQTIEHHAASDARELHRLARALAAIE